jgi:hypothetical protein
MQAANEIESEDATGKPLLRRIFLLTDGAVSSSVSCINYAKNNIENAGARMHTFAIGKDADM